MAVKIRLQRSGKKGKTSYRIVAIDESSKRNGRVIEFLGHFDPTVKPPVIKVNDEKVKKWIKNGAQLTDAVKNIVKI